MKNVCIILIINVLILSFFLCQKDDSFVEIIENDFGYKETSSIKANLMVMIKRVVCIPVFGFKYILIFTTLQR